MDVVMGEARCQESFDDNDKILHNSRRKQRESLATWIAAAELPLSTAEHPSFIKFATYLNPQWKKITRKMVMIDMLNIFRRIKKQLKSDFPSKTGGVSFSSSVWTGADGRGLKYIALSAHFVDDKTWRMNKRTLAFRPLESNDDDLYQCVGELLREFNLIDRCFGITFDNARLNKTSIPREFKPQRYDGELFHLRCACHVINKIVKIGLEEFSPYLTKFRDVLTPCDDRLKEFWDVCTTHNLTLKRIVFDDPDIWNTTYLMLKNYIVYEDVITSFYESAMKEAKEKLEMGGTLEMSETLEPGFWEVGRSFCSFLEVFDNAVRMLSDVYHPTTCLALENVYEMSLALRKARGNEVFRNVITRMDAKFRKYWYKLPMLYVLGAIMDPRIRLDTVGVVLEAIKTNMGWMEVGVKKDEIEKCLVDLYNSYASKCGSNEAKMEDSFQPPPGSLWEVIRDARSKMTTAAIPTKSELEVYLETDFRDIEDGPAFDILAWWEEHRVYFPVLSNMARDILTTPVSTITMDRAFLTTGNVMTEMRTRMHRKVLEAAVIIQDTSRATDRTHGVLDDEINDSFQNLEDLEYDGYDGATC